MFLVLSGFDVISDELNFIIFVLNMSCFGFVGIWNDNWVNVFRAVFRRIVDLCGWSNSGILIAFVVVFALTGSFLFFNAVNPALNPSSPCETHNIARLASLVKTQGFLLAATMLPRCTCNFVIVIPFTWSAFYHRWFFEVFVVFSSIHGSISGFKTAAAVSSAVVHLIRYAVFASSASFPKRTILLACNAFVKSCLVLVVAVSTYSMQVCKISRIFIEFFHPKDGILVFDLLLFPHYLLFPF